MENFDTTDDERYNDSQFVQRTARLVFAIKLFAYLDVVYRRRVGREEADIDQHWDGKR